VTLPDDNTVFVVLEPKRVGVQDHLRGGRPIADGEVAERMPDTAWRDGGPFDGRELPVKGVPVLGLPRAIHIHAHRIERELFVREDRIDPFSPVAYCDVVENAEQTPSGV
jgi:hypothetical protein